MGEELTLFTFPYQTNGSHATELSTVGQIISEWHWKSTFDFTEIVNNLLRIEARNIMSNCQIYFSPFSETIHTILKYFHSTVSGSVGRYYSKRK